MKKFKIKCSYSNGISITKFNAKIFDSNNCFITSLNSCDGYVLFSPTCYGVYNIIISVSGCSYITKLYLDDNTNCNIRLCFDIFADKKSFTFRLTDEFYPGLPIEKGELFLWNI